jgi:hypothetical protein
MHGSLNVKKTVVLIASYAKVTKEKQNVWNPINLPVTGVKSF